MATHVVLLAHRAGKIVQHLIPRNRVVADNHKLVPASPAYQGIRSELVAQPVGNHAQNPIASGMTGGVVDSLEPVEIEQGHDSSGNAQTFVRLGLPPAPRRQPGNPVTGSCSASAS